MVNKSAAFLSYSHSDGFVAQRLVTGLKDQGLPIFQDVQGLSPGEPWKPAIKQAIEQASCLVVLLSPESANSKEVLDEIEHAERTRTPIIPAVIRGSMNTLDGPVVERLRLLHCLQLAGPKGEVRDLRPLLRAIKRRYGVMSPVIAFSNLKGGVGKTTLAAQLSSALSNMDRFSILMIDLDPQANLTQFVISTNKHAELVDEDRSVLSLFERSLVYGSPSPRKSLTICSTAKIEAPEIHRIAYEVGNSTLSEISGARDNGGSVYIIPGQFELVKYTLPTASNALPQLEVNFAESIQEARREYDAVIFDLNPSSSFMIKCALSHATHIVCPIQPDIYSVQGLDGLKSLVERAFALAQPPEILAVLNAIPSWEPDLIPHIRQSAGDARQLRQLDNNGKLMPAIKLICDLLRKEPKLCRVLDTHIPDTQMLRAYRDNRDAAGFFSLARHLFRGPYGSRLASRLEILAKDIARTTELDLLDVEKSSRTAQEAEAHTLI